MKKNNSPESFLALLRAGLWAQEINLSVFGKIDYDRVLQLSEEQSVVGLVAAGLEHVKENRNLPLTQKLKFVGLCMQIEQRNLAMNRFIGLLVQKLQAADIHTFLVKGQGVAQCYECPLWRTSGDVDFLLDDKNYRKAIGLLRPLASCCKQEGRYSKHLGLTIDSWDVELQGTLRSGLASRIDEVIDAVHRDNFNSEKVRLWQNGGTLVSLPSPDNDVFLVFTHFLKHFFKGEGFCLRQICDWCRLLWTYRDEIDSNLLEERLISAGLMSEWKVFASFAIKYLCIPVSAMPLYEEDKKWTLKAEKVLSFLLKYRERKKLYNITAVSKIFPNDTFLFLPGILWEVNILKLKEKLVG